MNLPEKINIVKEKPLLLFSPLDWGLGHTFRSIPLIREFLGRGYKVIVACNSIQKAILEPELAEVDYEEVKGYDVRYARSGAATKLRILSQLPKILTQIKAENRWLNKFLQRSEVDLVVSDNRYGMYSKLVPSIILTHQLGVKSGMGRLADAVVRRFLYRFINRFSQCWVPDNQGDGLAGELSHPAIMPRVPVHYIGVLSRFTTPCRAREYKYKYCFIISGPEPQRTLFEQQILGKLKQVNAKAVVVRGLPMEKGTLPSPEDVMIYNYAGTELLQELICDSALIICRAGYTSIMDLVQLKKKMILVPTPGQTEQEYLAKYLRSQFPEIVVSNSLADINWFNRP